MKFVFPVSLQILFEIFFIITRNEGDMIENVYCCSCTVRCILLFMYSTLYIAVHIQYPVFSSDFDETWISLIKFREIFNYQILWKSVEWEPSCSVRTDRRTDMTKLIVAFRNFVKAPKKGRILMYQCGNLLHHDGVFDTGGYGPCSLN